MCAYVCVSAGFFKGQNKPTGAGDTGHSEMSNVGAEIRLRFSERAI